MNTSSTSSELETIIKIAAKAADRIKSYYQKNFEIATKDNDEFNFVTQADLEADQIIRSVLKESFPNDLILSEESDDIPNDYSGRVWMVDPLDGTKEFVNQGKDFSVMIGLADKGVPVLGCVVSPLSGKVYYAEKGGGAYVRDNGQNTKLQVSKRDKLSEATIIPVRAHGEVRPAEKFLRALPVGGMIEGSSLGLRVASICEQEADFFVCTNLRASKWDTCAPQIILEEAGGKMTDMYGKNLDYQQEGLSWENSHMATNGVLHEQVIEAIQGIDQLFIKK